MKQEIEQAIGEILKHGILAKDEIETAFEKYPESAGLEDCDALGDFLEQIGLITAFQAGQLRDQRTADLVMDNYIILDRLGEGGMGKVYRARHKRMRRIVAIKVLNPEIQENPNHLQRFQREIETLASLNHPGVIQAYDADSGPFGFFLVLEFVEGNDLDGIVRKHGLLPISEAVDAMIQSAKALQYVHDKGIIHRDIKPQNLMRDRQGNIKVADLGLVRINSGDVVEENNKQGLTQQFTIAGTLEFMAPEQAENTSAADNRADIYSLGCSLYFILTGQNVYYGKSVLDKLMAHQIKPIPSLRTLRSDVPEVLDKIFAKMVAKTTQDRYQTMNEVIRDLDLLKVSQSLPTGLVKSPEGIASSNMTSMPGTEEIPNSFPITKIDQGVTQVISSAERPAGISLSDLSSTSFISKEETAKASETTSYSTLGQVILVEPSKLQAMMIGNQLKSIGFSEVKTAATGAEAIELLNGGNVKNIVCSQNLPDGSGLELAAKLKSISTFNGLCFVLISSNIDAEMESQAASLQVKILRKPFSPGQLQATFKSESNGNSITVITEIKTKTVLLVDDSAFARRRMLGILREMGFNEVMEAGDGSQALELAKKHPYLFVISDFHMPIMDGKGLVENLSQDLVLKNLPVLLITSEPDSFLLDPIRNHKNCKILPKSAEAGMLKAEVGKFLTGKI